MPEQGQTPIKTRTVQIEGVEYIEKTYEQLDLCDPTGTREDSGGSRDQFGRDRYESYLEDNELFVPVRGGPRRRTFPARTFVLEEVDSLRETEVVFVREVKPNNMARFKASAPSATRVYDVNNAYKDQVSGVMYPPTTEFPYSIPPPASPIYPRTSSTMEVSAEEERNRTGSVYFSCPEIFGTPPVFPPRTRSPDSRSSSPDIYGDKLIDHESLIREIEAPDSPYVATSVQSNYYRRLLLSDHHVWNERDGLHEKKRRWAPYNPTAKKPRAIKNTDANTIWGKNNIDEFRKETMSDERPLHLIPQDELIETVARFATCTVKKNGQPYTPGSLKGAVLAVMRYLNEMLQIRVEATGIAQPKVY